MITLKYSIPDTTYWKLLDFFFPLAEFCDGPKPFQDNL